MKFPKSFTIGQYYCKKRNIPIIIQCVLLCPVSIIEGYTNGPLRVYFKGPLLIAEYKVLVNRRFKKELAENFIKAWVICDILPEVNGFIQDWKYKNGNFLIMPYSLYDIQQIVILDLKMNILHESSVHFEEPFPHNLSEMATASQKIYIRDFINTISEKLQNNYEDCIRRGISTLESLLISLNFDERNFNRKIMRLLTNDYYGFSPRNLQIINWNIWGLYKVRNSIVHNKLRSSYSDDWELLCHNLIGTLQYVITCCSLVPTDESESVSRIVVHYLFHQGMRRFHLDHICERMQSKQGPKRWINPDDMDDFMFDGLKITEEQFAKCGIEIKFDDFLDVHRRLSTE